MTRNTSIHKITNVIMVLIFIGLIGGPFVGYIFGWGVLSDLGEKRDLTQRPRLGTDSIKTIPEKFETYYKDHFGFRNRLIKGHNLLKYKFLKGGSFGKLLLGENDWLYLNKARMVEDYLGLSPFTSEELERWKTALERRQSWLAERGIRYLFVVAPNKAVIYPENLPDNIRKNKGRTKMEQLFDYLAENSDVEFLDLRPALLKAKETALIYHRHDSHWTDMGAYVVYKEICNRLPDIQPWPLENFTITRKKEATDLSMLLGLGDELSRECEYLIPRVPRKASPVKVTLPPKYPWPRDVLLGNNYTLALENKDGGGRLLFFHDSFSVRGGLRELLGEHFAQSKFIAYKPDMRCLELLVEQEPPDIVIDELVERKLREMPYSSAGPKTSNQD